MPQPIFLESGQEFTFTIKRGVGTDTCVSVNYDDFVSDVEVGDMLLVDGMLILYSLSSILYFVSLFFFSFGWVPHDCTRHLWNLNTKTKIITLSKVVPAIFFMVGTSVKNCSKLS